MIRNTRLGHATRVAGLLLAVLVAAGCASTAPTATTARLATATAASGNGMNISGAQAMPISEQRQRRHRSGHDPQRNRARRQAHRWIVAGRGPCRPIWYLRLHAGAHRSRDRVGWQVTDAFVADKARRDHPASSRRRRADRERSAQAARRRPGARGHLRLHPRSSGHGHSPGGGVDRVDGPVGRRPGHGRANPSVNFTSQTLGTGPPRTDAGRPELLVGEQLPDRLRRHLGPAGDLRGDTGGVALASMQGLVVQPRPNGHRPAFDTVRRSRPLVDHGSMGMGGLNEH